MTNTESNIIQIINEKIIAIDKVRASNPNKEWQIRVEGNIQLEAHTQLLAAIAVRLDRIIELLGNK